MAGMSDHDKQVMKGVFDQLDASGDGKISHSELDKFFNIAGHRPSSADIEALIARCDKDNTGSIDFNEFCDGLFGLPDNDRNTLLLAADFRAIDADGSGSLDAGEVRTLLAGAGMGEHAEELLAAMDTSGDGKVSFDEFKNAVMGM